MSNSENVKPLPRPPKAPFGRRRAEEEGEQQADLTADRMAAAMAEGKLDEFIKQEMPDNQYAKNLANMMMGMTGMMPMAGAPMMPESPAVPDALTTPAADQIAEAPQEEVTVPDDVRQAIMSGDVKGLMEKLRREHLKRSPEAATEQLEAVSQPEPAPMTGAPTIDKEMIDALVKIAQDNSVSLDWIMLRAIKVYVQEYQKTGKL